MEEKTVVETTATTQATDTETSMTTSTATEAVSTDPAAPAIEPVSAGTEEATEIAPATQEQAECALPTEDTEMDNPAETNSSVIETVEEEPTFTIPLSSLNTLNKLTAFIGEVYTYSYLINKATGAELTIDSRMCDDLAEAISLEEFMTVLKEFLTTRETEYVKGLEMNGDEIVFTCFQKLMDTGMKKAAASLFRLLSASITEKEKTGGKRLNLHKVQIKQPENEKFVFRTWLTRLGWKGSEGKLERNLLYRNLNGNTAFCTEESKIRWEAKHKKGSGRKTGEGTTAEEAEEATVAETENVAEIEPETNIEEAAEAMAV